MMKRVFLFALVLTFSLADDLVDTIEAESKSVIQDEKQQNKRGAEVPQAATYQSSTSGFTPIYNTGNYGHAYTAAASQPQQVYLNQQPQQQQQKQPLYTNVQLAYAQHPSASQLSKVNYVTPSTYPQVQLAYPHPYGSQYSGMQAIQYVHPQQIPQPQQYHHHLHQQVQQQQYIHPQQAYPIHQHYNHVQPQVPVTHAQPVAQFQFLYSPQSTAATKPVQPQPGGVIYATPTAAQQQYYHQQQPQPQTQPQAYAYSIQPSIQIAQAKLVTPTIATPQFKQLNTAIPSTVPTNHEIPSSYASFAQQLPNYHQQQPIAAKIISPLHYQHHQQQPPPPQQQLFAPYKSFNYGQPIAAASAQPLYSQIAPQHAGLIPYGAHMNYQPTMGRFHYPQPQKYMY